MKAHGFALPLAALALCAAGLVAYVLQTADQLPATVATHFGVRGEANGWMTRAGHVRFLLGFGLGMPVFFIAVFSIVRVLHGAGLNIPNRQLWLAPAHREDTLTFIQRQGMWFGCLFLFFFASIHHLILRANSRIPPTLPAREFTVILVIYLSAIILWTLHLVRTFLRKP
jgi:hypothetical protein